jgi:PhnB protein
MATLSIYLNFSRTEGGKVTMPLQEIFWGAYYGTCVDKFGVQWMFNCTGK